MSNLKQLKKEFQDLMSDHEIIVYDVSWQNGINGKTLEVPIMYHDGKMDLETCQQASEVFSDYLDEHDYFESEYTLDVCSPGAERELRSKQEVKEADQEYVYVKLANPKAGMHELKGYLSNVKDDNFTITYMDKTRAKDISIDFQDVSLIRLAVKV